MLLNGLDVKGIHKARNGGFHGSLGRIITFGSIIQYIVIYRKLYHIKKKTNKDKT